MYHITKDRAFYLNHINDISPRQLEIVASNKNSMFQKYLNEDGTLYREKLTDGDDVSLKIMFAELEEIKTGEDLA